MNIDLSPASDRLIERLVAEGRFRTRQDALDHAVELLRDETASIEDIRAGLASVERGEGIPLADAVGELRRKFSISDDA